MVKKFDMVRNELMEKIASMLKEDYDVLQVGSQEISLPIVNADGEEGFLNIVFKVPSGTHDGEAYDGYEASSFYASKVRQAKEKKLAAAKKKEEKAKKDAQAREERRLAKERAKALESERE